jgi:hypothetical protein
MPPSLTAVASDHGPVIGGNKQLGRAPPAPPPPDAKGPGAGNLSGLVLLLAIFAAIIAKIAQTALSGRPSAAMKAAQKKATQMAAEMRNAAQNPAKTSARKGLPKSKRDKGKQGSNAKFSRLGTEEDALGIDVEACGEEEDEDADENLRRDEHDFDVDEVPAAALGFGGRRGKARASALAGNSGGSGDTGNLSAPAGGPLDGGVDDAMSALCFGNAAAAHRAGGGRVADAAKAAAAAANAELESAFSYEESAIDFGGDDGDLHGDGGGDPLDLGGEDDDEEDFESDPDDDISPNDSVSNIGFSKPMAPPRFQRQLRGPKKQRPKRQPHNAYLMTSVMEDATEEEPDDHFMGLGQLNARGSRNLTGSGMNDDSFSMVHEGHMAMRARIHNVGDEMRVDLRDPASSGQNRCDRRSAGESCKPGGSCREPRRKPGSMLPVARAPPVGPPPLPPPDAGDSDAGSDVTFNFNCTLPASTKPPARSGSDDDDDNSDAASAVTFTFNEKVPPPPSSRRANGDRRLQAGPGTVPPPRALGKRHQNTSAQAKSGELEEDEEDADPANDDADSSVTLDFGAEPKRSTSRRHPPLSKARSASHRHEQQQQQQQQQQRRNSKPVGPAPAPTAAEDEGHGQIDSSANDDDAFTSVALSSRPRDPYLGMRGGRVMGGGIVGSDGKWHACCASATSPLPSRHGGMI